MDLVRLIVAGLVRLVIAVSPTLLASLWLPARYSMPPIRMTLISVVLSVVTSFVLQAELPDGILSVAPLVLALSLAWSLVLIPVIATGMVKQITHNKRPLRPLKSVAGRVKARAPRLVVRCQRQCTTFKIFVNY